tara:strand:- start:602 stop:925 length:324 start_codon:yes stop_codon:yes gene_type:complete
MRHWFCSQAAQYREGEDRSQGGQIGTADLAGQAEHKAHQKDVDARWTVKIGGKLRAKGRTCLRPPEEPIRPVHPHHRPRQGTGQTPLFNLAYNFDRLIFHERQVAAA